MGLPYFLRVIFFITVVAIFGTYVFYLLFKNKIVFRWLILFILVTIAEFALNDFLLFSGFFLFLILFFVYGKPKLEQLRYYFVLLPLVPQGIISPIPLPGFEQLFTLNYVRLLSLLVLFPIFISFTNNKKKSIFSYNLDKYIILYLLYMFFLDFRNLTFTNSIRISLNLFLDYFLIYFVISRTIDSIEDFSELFQPMIYVAFILCLIGFLEAAKHWTLYNMLFGHVNFLGGARAGTWRVQVTIGHIIFGAYLVVMSGFLLFLKYRKCGQNQWPFNIAFFSFFSGLLLTVARGPFLGFALLLIIFYTFSLQRIIKIVPVLPVIFFLFTLLPIGQSMISTLPYIGKEDQGSVTFRMILWENSQKVINRSPLFGNVNYLDEPEIQEMASYGGAIFWKDGRWQIDIVNSFLEIMLQYGIIGCSLFLLIFVIILVNSFIKIINSSNKESILLAKIFFSITTSLILILWGVSFISFLPTYIYVLFGLCGAYFKLPSLIEKEENRYSEMT